jgi:peptidoglycan/LPS O-acetylase OafA/YrhL
MNATSRAGFARWVAKDAGNLLVLTGLRGFAALWVYLYHVWGHSGHRVFEVRFGSFHVDLTPLVSMGGAGVTIFFVLSGFLLALPYAGWQAGTSEQPRYGHYLLRRILRVFPAYYVQLALLLAVSVALSGIGGWPEWSTFWRHLLMLFVPPPWGTNPINLVWWTLPIEFSFYLLLPFMAFLLRPGRWWILLAGSLCAMWLWRHSVILHLSDAPIQMRVYSTYQLAGSFDMFGLGMLAAVIHVNRSSLPNWLAGFLRSDLAMVMGLACLVVAAYWLAGNRQLYWADNLIFYLWTPLLSCGTVLVVLSGTGGSRVAAGLFANRPMIILGLVSYSFYLWHLPMLDWIVASPWLSGLFGKSFGTLIAISIMPILLASALSYLLVERPCMKLRR